MEDVVIIGAGPAGMTAHYYALMYGLTSVCIGDMIGGKLNNAPGIIDYPGIEQTSGKDFINQLNQQLKRNKALILTDHVIYVTREPSIETSYITKTSTGKINHTKTIIIACGNGRKQKVNHAEIIANLLSIQHDRGMIQVDNNFMTNVTGVFAAGDCLSYPNSLEQLSTSVTTGIRAAAGAYTYLKKSKPPILWGETKIKRFV